MDTSETYIKMSDCPEIQEQATFSGNDFVYNREHNRVVVVGYHDEDGEWLRGKSPIWLPTQDKLQEMVEDKYDTLQYMVHCFDDFVSTDSWHITSEEPNFTMKSIFTSMEQLWLAFYMKEKGKTWDGEGWIDATK